MGDRVVAIGDIHGCLAALDGLIGWLEPAATDTLVVLGDCIDRGPDSYGVIERMLALSERCKLVPLLGNHEEMLLAAIDRPATASTWLECGGGQTLDSYGLSDPGQLPHEHVLYLRTWTDYFETKSYFFAHGNYDPQRPLDSQEWGYQRWEALGPSLPAPHRSGKTAVVGHSSQKSGQVLDGGHVVCIDTFCCGGKWLTGFDTTNGEFYQVSADGKARRKTSRTRSGRT